jgi:uncharacterized protein YggE
MKRLNLSFFTLSLLLFGLVACAQDNNKSADHISVVGLGEVEREPDQAIMSIGINAQQANLPAAKKLADQRYRQVLKVLADMNINSKQIKATRTSAQPQYDWNSGTRVYKGELVARSLNVTINDLDKVSPLMQALVENEVSTIDGVTTGFQNKSALQRQALGLAADEAKAKAKFLAERLGRSLGSAYLVTEQNVGGVQPRRMPQAMMSKSMSTDGPPPEMFGTQKIVAQVSVSFYLL